LYFALLVNVFDFKNVKQKTNEVLNMILNLDTVAESPTPMNMILAIYHSVFVEGDQTNFEIEASFGVEASELYPDVKYTTVEEYLHQFV
jgi:hypothetical protein